MKKFLLAALVLFLNREVARADDMSKYKPTPPVPKSDFQRAIEHPIQPNPPPTALQKVERGEIPSSKNAMPSREGFSPTIDSKGNVGVQYQKSFK